MRSFSALVIIAATVSRNFQRVARRPFSDINRIAINVLIANLAE